MIYHRITWEQFGKDSKLLVKKIKEKNLKIDKIIVIALGGFSTAQVIIHNIKNNGNRIPIEVVNISHYSDTGIKKKQPELLSWTKNDLNNVLIVDDVYETGGTMWALHYGMDVRNVCTAVVYKKNKNEIPGLTYAVACGIDEWLILPWEDTNV